MLNFAYLQKSIIYASIKTLQIKLLLSFIVQNPFILTKKNHLKKLPFTPVGVRKFLKRCLKDILQNVSHLAKVFRIAMFS